MALNERTPRARQTAAEAVADGCYDVVAVDGRRRAKQLPRLPHGWWSRKPARIYGGWSARKGRSAAPGPPAHAAEPWAGCALDCLGFPPESRAPPCHRSIAERSEINSETQWVHRFGDDGIAPVNVLGLMTDELHRYRPRNPSPFEPPCADSTSGDPESPPSARPHRVPPLIRKAAPLDHR